MSTPLSPELEELARQLAAGLDDRRVAKETGVSLRTVRRRSARLLEALGAVTRFQAGYRYGFSLARRRRPLNDTSP